MYNDRDRRTTKSVNYLANVADLMSALLFVFILALVAAMLNIAHVNEERIQTNKKLDQLYTTYREQEDAKTALLTKIQKKASAKSADKLRLEVDPSQGVLRIPENSVTFPTGKSDVDADTKYRLAMLGEVLAEEIYCYQKENLQANVCQQMNPSKRTIDAIFIEGHTDNERYFGDSSDARNRELSTKRSNEVYYWMIYQNQELLNLKNPKGQHIFSISGYGSERPRVYHKNQSAEPANRRIELRLMFTPPNEADRQNLLESLAKKP